MDLSREARIADLQQRLASLPRDSWIAELSTKCPDDAAMRAEVLERLGHRDESSDPALVSQFVPFTGTARFVVRRQLGSGAFGTVYEAWDRDQQVAVALKLLHSDNPETLFRFKREFRALVDVRHANLVQLFELVSEGTRWFFTMELVKGRDFFQYVRPDAVSCQVDRLRHVLGQLAEGLRALHAAQRLHRDLKPANALVTDAGRLVLLDFGLVRELDRPTSRDTHSQIAGTPAYMAPELFREGQVSDASDWYALGVMLFEALTGTLPHDRSPQRFRSEPAAAALDPRSMNPHAPPDLSELCVGLLSNRPEERRDAAATIPAAPANAPGAAGDPSIRRVADVEHFIGRSTQLDQLDAAFADTQEGRLNVVLVNGPSGIGKTTLVKRFLSSLEQRQPDAIVLRGRCYEFESVPYKGVDSLVDELSRHLQRLPDARVEALLPRDASLLPKLFPVLGRVTAIATAPMRSAIVPDARELRQRTFRALREVFERLSDRHPMVVWIDDLQWGDRDSSTFLAELCAPPQQPALLLLLSYRNEDLMSNATLSYLHQVIANRGFPGNWHELSIAALNPEESRRLLTELLPPQIDTAPEARAKIIEEAGGHPLFLQQLASVTGARFSELTGAAGDGKTLELRQVLQDRVQHLPALAREILEFLCLAAQGLSTPVLFAAAENEDVTERADTLALLIRERLARSATVDAERRIEPAHDQVRAAVVAMLPEHTRRARHARLAHVLAAQPEIEPQVLVTHYQEAGDHEAAFDASLKAASLAESQLAFDRAAVFYQVALDSTRSDPVREAELYRKLAHTLGLAGRGRDSAHAFLRAADCAAAPDPFDLKRMAADQLMRSGFIDEGLELFDQLAQAIGVPRVRGPAAAVRGIVLSRIRTRLRLLTGPPQPAPTPVDSLELERLELLHTGGVILNIADPVLATFFQSLHILKALRVREPVHLAIALGIEASIRVAGGGDAQAALALYARARELAEAAGNTNALGLVYLLRAYLDYLLCRIPEGIRHSEQAIEFLSERCTGVAWEITAGYVLRFWFLCWAGYVENVRELLPRLLKEGAARGDVNMEVSLRLLSYVHYAYLSVDQPDRCISECREALSRWSRRGYHLQNYGAMFSLVECHLYLGEYERARTLLATDWDRMSRSFILRWQTLRIMVLFLKGRTALACWLDRRDDAALRREVRDCARKLARIRSHWTKPMAGVLRAGLAAGDQRVDEASRQLEQAAEDFQNASLFAYAATARHFAGLLATGDRGRMLMKSADDFLQSQHVVRPASFLRMLLPGAWPTPAA